MAMAIAAHLVHSPYFPPYFDALRDEFDLSPADMVLHSKSSIITQPPMVTRVILLLILLSPQLFPEHDDLHLRAAFQNFRQSP